MDVSREHIEIVQGAGGPKARILGHRVNVEHVVGWYEVQGMSVPEIIEAIPTITPADVHAALAYYWDHKEELEQQWAADAAWAKAYLEEYERDNPHPFHEARRQLEEKWRREAEERREAEDQQSTEERQRVG